MRPERPDRRELEAAGFEQVHIELERWDGPREGIGDIGGKDVQHDELVALVALVAPHREAPAGA
jgi:hypothetical protein